MTPEAIQAWLVARLAEELHLDPGEIDVREPFASYGLDSVRAVSLSGDLEDWLGRRLSPTVAYEYPTIEALARHLAGDPEPDSGIAAEAGAAPHLSAGDSPIAIVGMGCRFPGAENLEAFWRLLRDGIDAVVEVPPDRWDVEALFDPDPAAPGTMNTRWGGFLQRVDLFDPYAFGISPREAARMDPQQRLLLEVAWEALEDAGIPRGYLAGGRTGVFIGISSNDYGHLQLADFALADPHAGTGNALSIAANRLSYLLDLHGPSLAVDTACSSSLVAVHLACQSLRAGECAAALAGGVNVILSPALTVNFTKAGFMAPDGRCKAFDARADGYVRGEGAGLLVLKPLAAAQADGDRIYAVIRGSATNSDGRTNGLTAPNERAQIAVLREAYRRAGIAPAQVRFVECHGTGTALGDRIEAHALGAVLAEDRAADRPCAVGSVKTNIGHLEAAAGAAGLIKAALAIAHRAVPASLHFREPNPLVAFEALRLRVPRSLEPLSGEDGAPIVAGVSSFGFGGANAHVVLEEAPQAAAVQAEGRDPAQTAAPADGPLPTRAYLLPVSAYSPEALRAAARAWESALSDEAASPLRDLCYTAAVRRDHHDARLALVGDSHAALAGRLRAWLDGTMGAWPAAVPSGRRLKIAFVFSGQGPQWWAMGRELLESEPVFRDAVSEIDELLRPQAGWSLLDELSADEAASRMDRTDIAQPAVFALQVGLAALWRSWGVEPDAVAGHSVGEVAGACVAGALTTQEAVRVIYHRGRLTHLAAGLGRMAAVELSEDDAAAAIEPFRDRLWIAATNSPTSTTVAGDAEALDALLESLRARGVLCRLLRLDYAFHTPQMEPHHDALAEALGGLTPRAASRGMVSSVTGRAAAGEEFGPDYWRRNVRDPVRFAAAVDALIDAGCDIFVEIGPHPVLGGAVAQTMRRRRHNGTVLASLRRGEPERASLLGALGALYALGHPVRWSGLYPRGRVVRLPLFPWQRERFWMGPSSLDPRTQRAALTDAGPREAARDGAAPDGVPADTDAPPALLYTVAWEPTDVLRTPASPEAAAARLARQPSVSRGAWLVLADRGGVADALAARLSAQGATPTLVDHGDRYAGGERFTVRPDHPEDIRRLLAEVLDPGQPPCLGIIHLWTLDAALGEAAPVDAALDETAWGEAALDGAVALACASAVRLTQGLARQRSSQSPRLWLVTRGSQRVVPGDAVTSPAGGLTWGLGRTIAAEHGALWGGLIDLDPAETPEQAGSAIAAALGASDREDQVAIRGGRRYAARLRRWDGGDAGWRALRLRVDATYLITGGFGDLGLEVARWMVRRGARRLLLLGRTPLPPRAEWRQVDPESPAGRRIAAVLELEKRGASVHLAEVDVADASRLRGVLETFAAEGWPPIRGIVHAAGAAPLQAVADLDDAGLEEALRPKARGGWWLHRWLRSADLDFFVSFSSLSALLGSPRLAAYASANAFLDALAHHRRGHGLAALSVNWGVWGEEGMAARRRPAAQAAPRAVLALATGEALAALGWLMQHEAAQAGVLRFDWALWRDLSPGAASSPYLSHLYSDGAGRPQTPAAVPRFDRAALVAAAPEERLELIERFLAEQVALVLQIPAPRLDHRRPMAALGLDSMMAVQLKNQIESALDVEVDLVRFLEGPSIAEIARTITDDLAGKARTGVPAPTSQMVSPVPELRSAAAPSEMRAQIDHLSDDEVDALLLRLSGEDRSAS